MMSRFPAAFRPPAFASWSSCARWGTGPSLRSAYRSCCQGRTPTGLPRSARMSCGRGGCPLYPGDCGARTAGRSSPAAACRLAAACPCTPVQQPTTRGFLSRGIIKGSLSFTRPAFPSPVAPGWSGSPWAYSPELHTPPSPAAHVGVGTGIVGTCLSYVTISWSSSQRNHSPRATSCRTDLIRAFPPHPEWLIPVLSAPAMQQITGPDGRKPEPKETLTNIGASFRALPVRDIPARSLTVSMAGQSQGHGNGSRQVARSRSCRWRAEGDP